MFEYEGYDLAVDDAAPGEFAGAAFPVADSIDRFDSGALAGEIAAPAIRKDFPESWIWDSIDGYERHRL